MGVSIEDVQQARVSGGGRWPWYRLQRGKEVGSQWLPGGSHQARSSQPAGAGEGLLQGGGGSPGRRHGRKEDEGGGGGGGVQVRTDPDPRLQRRLRSVQEVRQPDRGGAGEEFCHQHERTVDSGQAGLSQDGGSRRRSPGHHRSHRQSPRQTFHARLCFCQGSTEDAGSVSESIIDLIYPHKFSTILEVDFGTPFDRHTIIEDSQETKKKKKNLPKLEEPAGAGLGSRLLRRLSK